MATLATRSVAGCLRCRPEGPEWKMADVWRERGGPIRAASNVRRIGLVLGGGGITGAAYELATLMAIELATGWHPNDADIVVGTSAGASVAAAVRSDRLDLDSLVKSDESGAAVAARIRDRVYRRGGAPQLGRWLRHGLAAGLRSPGLTFAFASPAPFDSEAIAEWIREQLAGDGDRWPSRATAIVAYDVAAKTTVAFGTVGAPHVSIADAVAASSAIPILFNPHVIDGRAYVDSGVASGTHADLVLGASEPLDLIIVIPPMAQPHRRKGGMPYETLFDRAGVQSLRAELDAIKGRWPHTEVLVLRPPASALEVMRPNPMDSAAAVPTFIRTLASMRNELGHPDVWRLLERHLCDGACDGMNETEIPA